MNNNYKFKYFSDKIYLKEIFLHENIFILPINLFVDPTYYFGYKEFEFRRFVPNAFRFMFPKNRNKKYSKDSIMRGNSKST